ncbi:MAG TPA: DUF697 domain-containing protein [Vicinamibacterales bacterium]|nr:DUF697 domain-containing protein [Vicinamibacterales bacterium]
MAEQSTSGTGTTPSISASVAVTTTSKSGQAEQIISSTARYAAGVGAVVSFVPMPLVDIAAVGALQWKMVKDLAEVSGTSFKGNRGKAVVGAALGALLPARLGFGGVGYALSTIPGGSIIGLATVPAFNYASTVAVGRVFHKHFASGGTLLNFDVDSMRDDLLSEYKKASDKYRPARA